MYTDSMVRLDLVAQKLSDYGESTRNLLREYLPTQEPKEYLYELVAEYPRRAGSMLRPSLVIATARSFGAETYEALHTAVAVELMHNAMLVHDDIEDLSEFRRNAPTLYKMAGVPLAINAGDALGLLSTRALLDSSKYVSTDITLSLLEEAHETMFQTVEGQALELGWRRDNVCNISTANYLEMVTKKTSRYTTIFPCRAGAMIGMRQKIHPSAFVNFGYFLGATFQIQDDLLNLVGDEEAYGKDLGGDIIEGKRTMMLIHLLNEAKGSDWSRVVEYLATPIPDKNSEDVTWVVGLMEKYGSLEEARTCARKYAGAALYELSESFAEAKDCEDMEFLTSMVLYTLEREV